MSSSIQASRSPRLADYFLVIGVGDTMEPVFPVPSQGTSLVGLELRPSVLQRYPQYDHPGTRMPPEVATFCFPEMVRVETARASKKPEFFSFVLTTETAVRLYGFALRFYEERNLNTFQNVSYTHDRSSRKRHEAFEKVLVRSSSKMEIDDELDAVPILPLWKIFPESLIDDTDTSSVSDPGNFSDNESENGLMNGNEAAVIDSSDSSQELDTENGSIVSDNSVSHLPNLSSHSFSDLDHSRFVVRGNIRDPNSACSDAKVYIRKAICVLSHWPLFDTFLKQLCQVYGYAMMTPLKSRTDVPVERVIRNLMREIPLPPRGRLKVLCRSMSDGYYVWRFPPNVHPVTRVPATLALQVLCPENIVYVFSCLLLEMKIVVVSSDPCILTPFLELMTSLLFPFHWMHVYIPVLPKGLMDFVYAPVPFLIGVPRAYFDENSIPFEVVVVDLDTDRLRLPAGEHGLPKLPEQKKKLLKELSNLEHDLSLNRSLAGASAGLVNIRVNMQIQSIRSMHGHAAAAHVVPLGKSLENTRSAGRLYANQKVGDIVHSLQRSHARRNPKDSKSSSTGSPRYEGDSASSSYDMSPIGSRSSSPLPGAGAESSSISRDRLVFDDRAFTKGLSSSYTYGAGSLLVFGAESKPTTPSNADNRSQNRRSKQFSFINSQGFQDFDRFSSPSSSSPFSPDQFRDAYVVSDIDEESFPGLRNMPMSLLAEDRSISINPPSKSESKRFSLTHRLSIFNADHSPVSENSSSVRKSFPGISVAPHQDEGVRDRSPTTSARYPGEYKEFLALQEKQLLLMKSRLEWKQRQKNSKNRDTKIRGSASDDSSRLNRVPHSSSLSRSNKHHDHSHTGTVETTVDSESDLDSILEYSTGLASVYSNQMMRVSPDLFEVRFSNILFNDVIHDMNDLLAEESPEKKIRAAFLRFFASLLFEYRNFFHSNVSLRSSKKNRSESSHFEDDADIEAHVDVDSIFDREGFIESHVDTNQPFVRNLVHTQTFSWFIDTRSTPNPVVADEVRFFDESIIAKQNRSVRQRVKESTPFLEDRRYDMRRVVPALIPEPLGDGSSVAPADFVNFRGCSGRGMFRLRPELLGYARHVEPLIVNSTEEDLRTTFARVPRGTILLDGSSRPSPPPSSSSHELGSGLESQMGSTNLAICTVFPGLHFASRHRRGSFGTSSSVSSSGGLETAGGHSSLESYRSNIPSERVSNSPRSYSPFASILGSSLGSSSPHSNSPGRQRSQSRMYWNQIDSFLDFRERQAAAHEIQRIVKGFLQRRRFRRLREAFLVVKKRMIAAWAASRTRKTFLRVRQASIRIQSVWRRYLQRCSYLRVCKATLVIQTFFRRLLAERRFFEIRRLYLQNARQELLVIWKLLRTPLHYRSYLLTLYNDLLASNVEADVGYLSLLFRQEILRRRREISNCRRECGAPPLRLPLGLAGISGSHAFRTRRDDDVVYPPLWGIQSVAYQSPERWLQSAIVQDAEGRLQIERDTLKRHLKEMHIDERVLVDLLDWFGVHSRKQRKIALMDMLFEDIHKAEHSRRLVMALNAKNSDAVVDVLRS